MKLEKLVIIFYIWLLAEGAVRKWLFPSLTDGLYFVKYLLAIIIFIRIRELRKTKTFYSDIKTPISVFVLFCCLSLFYTSIVNNPLVGVLGIIAYLCFIPATMVLPYFINTEEKLKKLVVTLAIISIGVCLLAIWQYNSPYDAFINKYATNEQSDIATAGLAGSEVVRVTTLFSYHSGNAIFAVFSFIFIFSLLFEKQKRILIRNLIYVSFGLSVINLFMTGSRAAVFVAFSVVAGFMLFKSAYFIKNTKMLGGLILMVVLIGITMLYTDQGRRAFDTWNERFEAGNENNEYESRNNVLFNEIYEAIFEPPGGLMGYGIGTYQNGSSRFNKINNLPGAEDQAHRIGLEIGPFGLIIWFMMMLAIFIYSFRVYRFVKTPFLKNLSLLLAFYAFWGPALYRQTVVNWVDNATWWTCLGIILSIKQIEVNKRNLRLKKRGLAIQAIQVIQ
jgi:hypothetical protein